MRPLFLGPLILALALTGGQLLAQGAKAPEISFGIHKFKEENVEGPDVERTYIDAGEKRIVIAQPKGCHLSSEGDQLDILLNDSGLDGEIHVSRSAFTVDVDLAVQALKYREAASKDLPRGATNVEVLQPVMNAYPYNGWKSLGFIWTYTMGGRSMVRTVSYVNLEIGAQIVVTTVADRKDAEAVSKIARKFMSSWWVMSNQAGS